MGHTLAGFPFAFIGSICVMVRYQDRKVAKP